MSLLNAGKMFWKRFAVMWAFPIFLFASLLHPAYAESPGKFFVVLQIPTFAFCLYIATAPIRSREVGPFAGAFWVIVVPFLIWTSVILGVFGLAFLA